MDRENDVKVGAKNIPAYKKTAFWLWCVAGLIVVAGLLVGLPEEAVSLPDFAYQEDDPLQKLVYRVEVERNSNQRGFTIVAPRIHGHYRQGERLKIFVTTHSGTYQLNGKALSLICGCVMPAALTFEKDYDGNYTLLDYRQAQDGAGFAPSIREFCNLPISGQEIAGLAEQILAHYGDYGDLRALHMDNLSAHLQVHGQIGVTLSTPAGETILLTAY